MKRKNLYLNLILTVAIFLTGCSKDMDINSREDLRSGFTLTAVAESMSPEHIVTRASDPKTEEECEIHSLHVFLFGPDGNYLTRKTDNDLYQGYQYIGSPTLHINGDAFADPTAASNATIYVVANVEAGTFGAITADRHPKKNTQQNGLRDLLLSTDTTCDRNHSSRSRNADVGLSHRHQFNTEQRVHCHRNESPDGSYRFHFSY